MIDLPENHRFPIRKYELVRQQLIWEGVIGNEWCYAPDFIEDEVVLWTHDATYWAEAKALELDERHFRKIGFPKSAAVIDRSLSSASGTVHSALHALNDGLGLNLAGGTHHAYRDRGEGYCLLNDIAIAANYLLRKGLVRRILVVDLDVHQGNGTASIFRDSAEVFTFSVHCAANYPFQKESSDLDIALSPGTGDREYLEILRQHLPRVIEEAAPDLVFYQAGVDVLATDRLGKLALSMQGCMERDLFVANATKNHNIPLVVVMGGGYPERMPDVVKAHANVFKSAITVYEKNWITFN